MHSSDNENAVAADERLWQSKIDPNEGELY